MKQAVMAVGTLTEDPDFDSVTEPKEDVVGNFYTTALLCDVAVIDTSECVCVCSDAEIQRH